MADKKMTAREFYTAVIGGKVGEAELAYAREAILKLDNKNAKRKAPNGEIKEENKPIAEAILSALANGSMTSPDLAKAIGQNTQKTNGVAGEMVKLGMLDKFKVKVKGKGELTAYALATTDAEGSGVEGE
jgi:hypothetical protein